MGLFTIAHKLSQISAEDREKMFSLENIDEIKPFLTH